MVALLALPEQAVAVVALVAFPLKLPLNEVAFTLPLTSNLYPVVGLEVPIPILPLLSITIAEELPL